MIHIGLTNDNIKSPRYVGGRRGGRGTVMSWEDHHADIQNTVCCLDSAIDSVLIVLHWILCGCHRREERLKDLMGNLGGPM